jgi:hypothetical protein
MGARMSSCPRLRLPPLPDPAVVVSGALAAALEAATARYADGLRRLATQAVRAAVVRHPGPEAPALLVVLLRDRSVLGRPELRTTTELVAGDAPELLEQTLAAIPPAARRGVVLVRQDRVWRPRVLWLAGCHACPACDAAAPCLLSHDAAAVAHRVRCATCERPALHAPPA